MINTAGRSGDPRPPRSRRSRQARREGTTGSDRYAHHARPRGHHARRGRRGRQRGELLAARRGRGGRSDPPAGRAGDPRGMPAAAGRSRYAKGLPTGQAVATTAGRLPARWVIHTVGPVYARSEDRSRAARLLLPRVAAGRRRAGRRDRRLPGVSAGVYGWPLDDAARIAVGDRTRTAGPRGGGAVRAVHTRGPPGLRAGARRLRMSNGPARAGPHRASAGRPMASAPRVRSRLRPP